MAGELRALGADARTEEGGVGFSGSHETIARANLWLRTASRITVRVASFRAHAFHELARLARAIPWERFVARGAAVRFRVTSHGSKLYHTGGIAQRLAEAVEHRLGGAPRVAAAASDGSDESGDEDAQLFVVLVERDRFLVSADSSGALLHQRGYRQAVGKAPLRETIAAALLLASGWSGTTPLVDPMCGSGTIPIEGALLARRIAPGLRRRFKLLDWPEMDPSIWERVRGDAARRALSSSPVPITGSDRDAGSVEAARANAERAGVGDDVSWSVRALSAMDRCTTESGTIATNPPYGVRVGDAEKLRDLYARFGSVARERCPGWQLALLSANPRLDAQLQLSFEERLRTRNGGIPVRLLLAEVPVDAAREG